MSKFWPKGAAARPSLADMARAARDVLQAIPLPFRRRRRRLPVVKPYVDLNTWRRKLIWLAFPVFLGFFCLVYGFFFALTAPYLIVPFAAPIALLALMAIWALPDRPHAPTKTMELFFSALLICLVLWPNYLALSLPGLPWVTAIRLTGFPMALLMLVSLSTSPAFRAEVKAVITPTPALWVWFAVFVASQFLTLALADSPGAALQRAVVQQVNWTCVAVVAAWLCRMPGRVERYVVILLLLSLPLLVIAWFESGERHLLWNGYVPSFLKIDDPVAALIFSSIVRSATGQYRVKGVFSTPLGLAEYFALLTPFAMHFAINRYPLLLRALSWALVPALFIGVRMTDARLGVVGYLVSVMLYLLFWGMLRFKRNRRDLLAATLVYVYPAVFCAAALAVTTVQPIHKLVFGGGETAASNQARTHQLIMGIPNIMKNPIGHGAGGGGKAMGYGEGAFIAIDNYYLLLGLEFGVLGLVAFLGVFLVVITWSARSVLQPSVGDDREAKLLLPLAVCLSAFLVIKSVFAQTDLHPMLFIVLGFSAGLIYRVQQAALASKAQWEAEDVEKAAAARARSALKGPGRLRRVG